MFACTLARLAAAPLHAIYVREPYPYVGIGEASRAALLEYEAATQQQAKDAFARVAALAKVQGVTLSTATDEGHSPAEHIGAFVQFLEGHAGYLRHQVREWWRY